MPPHRQTEHCPVNGARRNARCLDRRGVDRHKGEGVRRFPTPARIPSFYGKYIEMANERPPISAHLKRKVRKRCAFGCVICGLPLYTYEHMKGYALVKRHVDREMTLLCDKHQRERTNGLLPLSMVEQANRNPYNKRTGVSHPYDLHYAGDACEIVMGGNVFLWSNLKQGMEMIALAIDNIPLAKFMFDQGHLFISLQAYDESSARVLWD